MPTLSLIIHLPRSGIKSTFAIINWCSSTSDGHAQKQWVQEINNNHNFAVGNHKWELWRQDHCQPAPQLVPKRTLTLFSFSRLINQFQADVDLDLARISHKILIKPKTYWGESNLKRDSNFHQEICSTAASNRLLFAWLTRCLDKRKEGKGLSLLLLSKSPQRNPQLWSLAP